MNVMWIKIDSWHIKKAFWPWADAYMAETVCGLQFKWDGVEVDRLPGGAEKSCENCLRIYARKVDEPTVEVVKQTKRARKIK